MVDNWVRKAKCTRTSNRFKCKILFCVDLCNISFVRAICCFVENEVIVWLSYRPRKSKKCVQKARGSHYFNRLSGTYTILMHTMVYCIWISCCQSEFYCLLNVKCVAHTHARNWTVCERHATYPFFRQYNFFLDFSLILFSDFNFLLFIIRHSKVCFCH